MPRNGVDLAVQPQAIQQSELRGIALQIGDDFSAFRKARRPHRVVQFAEPRGDAAESAASGGATVFLQAGAPLPAEPFAPIVDHRDEAVRLQVARGREAARTRANHRYPLVVCRHGAFLPGILVERTFELGRAGFVTVSLSSKMVSLRRK
jgi:hypothetical protein